MSRKVPPAEAIDVEVVSDVDLVDAEWDDPTLVASTQSKRSLFQRLLSPETLQWMMACGSALLVLGFVVWLWSHGVFEQPIVIASICGAATTGFIAAGVALVLKTRHQLAGRWLTYVGALAMPLNLWLYDAQGLITIADGGHLWIPAAFCCVIYAGIARVLKDATFVYTLVGGVVLTGMLFLADQSVGRFWHWLPPVKFLLVVGWISVFADRLLFAAEAGEASSEADSNREKSPQTQFGLAFFRSGVVLVVCGLGVLLSGYVSVAANGLWFSDPWLPLRSVNHAQNLWALGMVAASALGFFTQGLMRRSRSLYVGACGLCVWAVLILINLLAIPLTVTSIAIVLAALTMAFNVLEALRIPADTDVQADGIGDSGHASQLVVVLLFMLSLVQMVFQIDGTLVNLIPALSWWTALQYSLSAAAAASLAWKAIRSQRPASVSVNAVLAGMMGVFAFWTAMLIPSISATRILVFVVPAIALGAVLWGLFRKTKEQDSLSAIVASTMTSTHLLILVASRLTGFITLPSAPTWAVVLGLASLVYALASRRSWSLANRVSSLLAAIAGVSVLGGHLGFDLGYGLILASAVVATGMKVIVFVSDKDNANPSQPVSLDNVANVFLFQSGSASVFLAMSRWLDQGGDGWLLAVMLIVLTCVVGSSLMTANKHWRGIFRGLILAILGSTVCLFEGFLSLNGWHRGEICSLLAGGALLVLGHLAWMREEEEGADLSATLCLFFGSLLVVIPLAVGLIYYRFTVPEAASWRLLHEVASIFGGLGLLAVGMLFRVRSTAIGGASLILTYLVSLVALIRIPAQLQNASVVMMVGGGLFLGTAILMSIYRDRLVALPEKVAEREGVFQVLKWR